VPVHRGGDLCKTFSNSHASELVVLHRAARNGDKPLDVEPAKMADQKQAAQERDMSTGTKFGILNAVIIVGLIFCYFGAYLPRTIVGIASVVLVFANILMYRKLGHTSN
jgi:hypothetical protein